MSEQPASQPSAVSEYDDSSHEELKARYRELERAYRQLYSRNQELEKLLSLNPQTGLPIRRVFERDLEDIFQQARDSDTRVGFAVGVLRLDKEYARIKNSRDRNKILLFKTAVRIQEVIGEGLYQSDRLDEFHLLIPGMPNADIVEMYAAKIAAEVSLPHEHPAEDVRYGCNIGLAWYPAHGMSRDELLGNADIALGESESSGRSFVVYTPQLGERYRERLRIERLLSADIADDFKNFSIVYQPFVNTRGKIVGSEALVRWNNPELGEVSPARFVPIAEESGDIRVMGQWVLFNACRHLRDWRKQYDKELYVSVNLSPLQFKQPDLVDRIQGVLAALGLEGDGLKLEITEGVIMEDPTDAIEKMEGLKAAGIRISVDDFGTGYSSLNYLKRFPIDTVKIDKSFVEDLENNVSNQEIVKAIISMAHNIRIETLAEGVETVSQFDFLVNEQCRIIQGYLFSRPINAAGFEDFLRNGEALKPS